MKRLTDWFRDTFAVWSDWKFRDVNWINIDVLRLYYERAHYSGNSEVELAILGLHLRVTWTHNREVLDEFAGEMCRRRRLVEAGFAEAEPVDVQRTDDPAPR